MRLLNRLFGVAFCAISLITATASDRPRLDWDEARQFWAFQTPRRHPLPAIEHADWPRQPLDFFVLRELEQRAWAPSPPAERRVLLRRAAFALTGLPPTPDEVESFVADESPDAYVARVEAMLSSPRFGERLASMWLTAARYAEDQAHQVGSDTKHFYPNAFKYRQWVIDAFNRDLPYNEFIRLQLAADQIDSAGTNDWPALGFVGLGPKYYNRGRPEVMADEWEDRVDTTCRTFLALTVACARCHDHKYDPITMSDYYGLAGVFASTKMVNRPLGAPSAKPDREGTESEKNEKKRNEIDPADPTVLHMVEDGDVRNLHVFLRGDVTRPGPEAPRRFLRVLCDGEPERFHERSGRRELAEAIADRRNPLTARVMVNRVWNFVFGQPLAGTPSNFGSLGERPSHPELLDDLAVRFMENGWSVKQLVREMALSATFRQSSALDTEKMRADPENKLLWRVPRRRLTVEMWRDAVLTAAGELEYRVGPSLELDDPQNVRRTVFGRVSRLELNRLLMQYDYPDPNVHSGRRSVTTTPVQKLFMLNSPFIIRHSQALAERVLVVSGGSVDERTERLFKIVYGRPPTPKDSALARAFFDSAPAQQPESETWRQLAQALLVSNEMLYLD